MRDPDRLVIHVGPPRTGTTSLQLGAFARHPAIQTLGKPFDVPGVDHEVCQAMADLCDGLWKLDGLAFDWNEARRLRDRALDRPWPEAATVRVLSEEGLGHGGAVDRLVVARRVRRLFGRCRVLVTVRDPVDAVASYHGWAHARGFVDQDVDDWVTDCARHRHYDGRPRDFPLTNARFGRLALEYARLFGHDRILVLPLEVLRRDAVAYAERLGRFLDVDPGPLAAHVTLPARNPRVGRLESRYQRLIKRAQARRARGRATGWRPPSALAAGGAHEFVRRLIGLVDRPPRPMSEATRRWLEHYYASDRAILRRIADV